MRNVGLPRLILRKSERKALHKMNKYDMVGQYIHFVDLLSVKFGILPHTAVYLALIACIGSGFTPSLPFKPSFRVKAWETVLSTVRHGGQRVVNTW